MCVGTNLLYREHVTNKQKSFQHKAHLPASVAGDWIPPLVFIDVDTFDVCLHANVVCATGQTLEEATVVAPSVYPCSVVIANPPHYASAVTFHYTQVASNLSPEPARQKTGRN